MNLHLFTLKTDTLESMAIVDYQQKEEYLISFDNFHYPQSSKKQIYNSLGAVRINHLRHTVLITLIILEGCKVQAQP